MTREKELAHKVYPPQEVIEIQIPFKLLVVLFQGESPNLILSFETLQKIHKRDLIKNHINIFTSNRFSSFSGRIWSYLTTEGAYYSSV